MSVVNLQERRAANQSAVWEAYCAAARRAQATNEICDAIEAGRQWRRWLDLFMTPEQRGSIATAVLPSERRS